MPVLRFWKDRLEGLVERLEDSHPALAQWLGDRLDLQVPAVGLSLFVHFLLLVCFALVGYAATGPLSAPEFRTEVVSYELNDFAKMETTEIAELDNTVITPVLGSFSPTPRALMRDVVPSPVQTPPKPVIELKDPNVAKLAGVVLPTAPRLDQSLSIQGNGAEHVGAVEGAVDRMAVEILRRLERGRTLVVWAFDASNSLLAERERLAKYIDNVYAHVLQLDHEQLSEDKGLLTVVVGFGQDRKILTPDPTTDRAEIIKAITSVAPDTSGIESTFRTVGEIARKYGHYKPKGGSSYQTMCIVVTDEVGDDEDRLEEAIQSSQAVKMPVFVLGSPALFGRADGYQNYTDPKTKQTYYGLPVRAGPESVVLEGIRLPFWYDGPQHDFLDAGFGPWALSRLAGATGGIYFITRMGMTRVNFDPAGMREYRPDWVSREQYMAAVNRSPMRRAVMRAGMITQQTLPQQPGYNFPPADVPEFKEVMKRNQEIVARIQYTIDEALGVTGAAQGEPTLMNTGKQRDHEGSRRWQAHYDLLRGRLLAMKLRCLEYNAICAKMLKDPPKFSKPSSNAWRLTPDPEVHISDRTARDNRLGESATAAAEEAKMLLTRVVREHPGTPWALLAQRELKDDLGLRWREVTIPPAPKPRPGDQNNNQRNRRNNNPSGKPPELPKL